MPQEYSIYHNPRCSKSRQTLAILESEGITPNIILYLQTPPTDIELKNVLKALKLTAREIIRTGEKDYKELQLNDHSLSEAALISALTAHPKLIERPIVCKGSKAVIGRPPENVRALIQ